MKLTKTKFLTLVLIICFTVFPLGHILKLITPFKFSILDLSVFFFIIISLFLGFLKPRGKGALLRVPGLVFISVSLFLLLVNSLFLDKNDFITGLFYWLRFGLYFVYYLILANLLKKEGKIKKVLDFGLIISGFLLGFFGIIQYFVYPDLRNLLYLGWDPHYFRVFSTLFDPNFTGVILVLTIFQFIFLIDKIAKKFRFFYFLGFIVTFLSLILTHSRSVYLALFSGLFVFLLSLKKIKTELVIGIIGTILIAFIFPKPHLDVYNLLRTPTAVARIKNVDYTFKEINKSPLIGRGFGTITYTDSSLVYVLATCGLVGFFFFSWFCLRVLIFGLTKNKKVLVIIAALFTASFFNNVLFYPWVLFWFYGFLASEEMVQGS